MSDSKNPADTNSDPDLSGRSLGDYRMLRRLGRGGMAEVYLAEQGSLRRQVARFVQELRGLDLRKLPSVSEAIDWARTLVLLHARELDPELVRGTLNVLLKFEADVEAAEARLGDLLRAARREADIRPAAQ